MDKNDKLKIGKYEFNSRFILGSGKYSLDLIKAAVENAGAEIITLALRRAISGVDSILDYIPKGVKLLPNTPNKKAIFKIDAIAEPSICIVDPIGSVVLDTSLSIFNLSAHSKLDGKLAKEEQVPKDVTVGVNIFL